MSLTLAGAVAGISAIYKGWKQARKVYKKIKAKRAERIKKAKIKAKAELNKAKKDHKDLRKLTKKERRLSDGMSLDNNGE